MTIRHALTALPPIGGGDASFAAQFAGRA